MSKDDYKRFESLGYEDFRRMAQDDSLSRYEKIGFPDSYRAGREAAIFADIAAKLPRLGEAGKTVLDIGPGCSELPSMLADLCRRNRHTLLLVDSEEMLARLPDEPFVRKFAGFYPACAGALGEYARRVDALLCYSVLHYVFVESSVFEFLDSALELLAPGGEMLLGDIPNVSMRKRFFASEAGARFHREFTGRDETPEVEFNRVERGRIDDAVVLSLVARARAAGCDAYVVPQGAQLPMANRREDILIRKP
ncbi:MAG TPA: hypothetical protein VF538_04095 [Pyrinomonadaceae bacterium]|jgi:hypothetical protein